MDAMGDVQDNFITSDGTDYNMLPIDADGPTQAVAAPTPPTYCCKVTWFIVGL